MVTKYGTGKRDGSGQGRQANRGRNPDCTKKDSSGKKK